MEIKPKKRLSFRIKITGSIMLCFTIVLAVISVLFYHTTNKMRGEAIYRLEYSTREIGQSVDEIIQNIYGVSDAFALDDKLSHYTNGDYSDNPIKKRRDIVIIVNSLFIRQMATCSTSLTRISMRKNVKKNLRNLI